MPTKVDYEAVEPRGGALHFLRDPLEADQLGVTVLDAEPGWTGMEHDHADEDHEEVYLLLEGEASMAVDGETIDLEPGEALRVEAGATRQIRIGDEESTMVIVGAP